MRFPDPLIRGRLIKRYKRFLADVEIDGGEIVTAHCPNPGSMLGLDIAGVAAWLSDSKNPKRKLRFTLEMLDVAAGAGAGLVSVNTGRANRIGEEAIAAGRIPELAGYPTLRREVRYGENSRIDLLLEAPGRPPCYVEIKSVTLKRDRDTPGLAEFPDAVTKRGTKHLAELAAVATAGGRAAMLYLVQRGDCDRFALAADIDPDYARGFAAARAAGVEILCYACKLSPETIELDRPLRLAMGKPI